MDDTSPPSADALSPGEPTTPKRAVYLAILVAALGYFVDIYDLILFGVVRTASLRDLGVADADMLEVGSRLLDAQMWGMLLGGIAWGVLGDRRGRLSVLFGSILTYSIANIANGFVNDLDTYWLLRFVAGVGLAGELGAGMALVAELMPAKSRGWGTTIVASIGICGAVAAVAVGDTFEWRQAYWVGGGLGLFLLVLRLGVLESGMYQKVRSNDKVARGNFFALFTSKSRLVRYVAVILCGVPIWYAVGILTIFSPEIGEALGMSERPNAGTAIMACYIGLALGDLASGALSQLLRSRRRALAAFLVLDVVAVILYFTVGPSSQLAFNACVGFLGFASGYWAVFVTVGAEQFGTNLRATAATTVPNFVRGSLVLLSASFRGLIEPLGAPGAAIAVGVVVIGVAFLSLLGIQETFGKSLDYVEE